MVFLEVKLCVKITPQCKGIWDKVFKSGLSNLFKGYPLQNLLSPLLNALSQINYRLNHIITFNIRLLTFTKFVEFLHSVTVKEGLRVFSYFRDEDVLKLCIEPNESQPKYYAHKKS